MNSHKMWIGGEWLDADSGKTFAVYNPATEEEIGQVPLGAKSDVDKAVEAARKAFPIWSKKSQAERSKIVSQIADLIRENAEELVSLEVLEHGTPIEVAKMLTSWSADMIEFAAQAARTLMGNVIPAFPDTVSYYRREPLGVCGLIAPWNVPLMMMAAKLGPALAAGNSCVVKPPSVNSLIGLKFAEILAKADLPRGTVNLITGPGGSVGDALSSHPDVAMIAFTGSTETGKAIIASSSKSVKRLMLELGGKNPVIVLEDADLENAANIIAEKQCLNSGMTCGSPGRIYVHENIHDEFVERFVAAMERITVGHPSDVKTVMGPVVSAEHRDKVESYIRSGIKEGATLILGGTRPAMPPMDRGYYVVPTVFINVTQDMTIAREEIFGPVACIMKFTSEADVIEQANDNVYGLCASVWTRDVGKGIRYGEELRVGSFWVNQHNHITTALPWGGIKDSGIGKESGVEGLKEFTTLKLMCFELPVYAG